MEQNRTANLLGALALALADRIDSAAESAGLGRNAAAAVAVVGFYPGRESIEALSRVLRLSHSGTVRLVDRLVAVGLMTRDREGRSVSLTLTPEGEAAKTKVLTARHAAVAEALGALSDREEAALTHLTERLLGAVTRAPEDADHICRLCDEDTCPADRCPVECALHERQDR